MSKWYTKKGIQDDLEEATGMRIMKIDDRFTVSGEGPPHPVTLPDEENEEFRLMFGVNSITSSTHIEPDLCGIKHMLQMVNEYNGTPSFNDDESMKELNNTANTVIAISKLDPTAPAFVPKNIEIKDNNGISNISECSDCIVSKESNSNSTGDIDLDYKSNDIKNKTESSHVIETNNNDIDVTKKIDVASLNPKEIDEMRQKLKLKIVSASTSESGNKKRERNLAMASLLKLCTNTPKSVKQSEPTPLKTPEYFITFPTHVSKVTDSECIKDEQELKTVTGEGENNTCDEDAKCLQSTSSPVHELVTSQENSDVSEANLKEHNDRFLSEEIRESVKKVDKWLDGPNKNKENYRYSETETEKSRALNLEPMTFKKKGTTLVTSSESPSSKTETEKSHALHLEPVTFKKKGTTLVTSSESPSSKTETEKSRALHLEPVTFKKKGTTLMTSSESPSSSNTNATPERQARVMTSDFVPSSYANELTKTYMERSQTKLSHPHEDIWTNLERKLKEKEEAMKRKLL